MISTTACVTGASGFVGTHVTGALLERGHTVRATVRDAADADKTAHLAALAEGLPGILELHSADLMRPGSFDPIVQGCQQVYHVASAVYLSAKDPQRQIVDPALQGTENVLSAVARASTVQALGVASSVTAVVQIEARPGYTYTEADWNSDATLEQSPYPLSKTLAERAVWRWHAALPAERRLPLTVVNPVFILGPVHARVHMRTSPSIARRVLLSAYGGCPRISFPIVDVRDVADALLAGVERGATGRYLLHSASLWMREIAQILAPAFPEYRVRTLPLPDPLMYAAALFDKQISLAWARNNLNKRALIDASKVTRELGIRPRPARDSVLDTISSCVELGLVSPERVKHSPLDGLLQALERRLPALERWGQRVPGVGRLLGL